jgi:hypothetical protein
VRKRAAALEEVALEAAPASGWTRERFKAALERRYSPRMHMSLILAASGFSAMLTSTILHGAGIQLMLVRYPAAIAMAYAIFLVGVWTWLRVMGFVDNAGKRPSKGSNLISDIDLPSGGGSGGGSWGGGGASRIPLPRGGGGSFDGGGASASFAEGRAPLVATNLNAPRGSGVAGKAAGGLLDGLDGDGIVLLLLALALAAAIFVTSGYLVWCAPDVLTEAAFGAALAGSLAKPTRNETPHGWIGGVVRKTWWPFAIVMVVALIFAAYAHAFFPQAATFRQAVALALG